MKIDTLFQVVDISVYAGMYMQYVLTVSRSYHRNKTTQKTQEKITVHVCLSPECKKKMQDENRGSMEERGGEERGEENEKQVTQ